MSLTFWDKVLIVVMVGAVLASPAAVDATIRPAHGVSAVTVAVRAGLAHTLPLDHNKRIRVKGVGGGCVVEIAGGQALVVESDCPKELCLSMGPVGADGGIIICLPHEITISPEAAGSAEAVDAVVR